MIIACHFQLFCCLHSQDKYCKSRKFSLQENLANLAIALFAAMEWTLWPGSVGKQETSFSCPALIPCESVKWQPFHEIWWGKYSSLNKWWVYGSVNALNTSSRQLLYYYYTQFAEYNEVKAVWAIYIYFLAFLPSECVSHSLLPRPLDILTWYILHIFWSVGSPHGQ